MGDLECEAEEEEEEAMPRRTSSEERTVYLSFL